MKTVHCRDITERVAQALQEANIEASEDLKSAYRRCADRETSPLAASILCDLAENADLASCRRMPICQDTGTAVVFLTLGQDVQIRGGFLGEAIQEGVVRGYREGYLRKSIAADPVDRTNTGDNTPAVIHTELVPGDRLEIAVVPKGGGGENASRLCMLTPAQGVEGFREFLLETVRSGGASACPPLVVGACLGGNFETCALHAKKALLRPIGSSNPDARLGEMELELLADLNRLGIGPQGLGGRTTAFAVHLIFLPCHIASLPAAVNINCHASRHRTVVF